MLPGKKRITFSQRSQSGNANCTRFVFSSQVKMRCAAFDKERKSNASCPYAGESPIGAKRVASSGDHGPCRNERWISAEGAGSIIIIVIRQVTSIRKFLLISNLYLPRFEPLSSHFRRLGASEAIANLQIRFALHRSESRSRGDLNLTV
jgi:hypothetical protein